MESYRIKTRLHKENGKEMFIDSNPHDLVFELQSRNKASDGM